MPMIRTMTGNHKCGSVAIARVRDCCEFFMVVLELPVIVVLIGDGLQGGIHFAHLAIPCFLRRPRRFFRGPTPLLAPSAPQAVDNGSSGEYYPEHVSITDSVCLFAGNVFMPASAAPG